MQHFRILRDDHRAPLMRACALLMMAALLYLLWPSAEIACLAVESALR